MKPNNSYAFSIALNFLFSLAISCTKDTSNPITVTKVCDTCSKVYPATISLQFRDSNWTRMVPGAYISHLNDFIKSSTGTIKNIYSVSVSSANGLIQVPLNYETYFYSGTISFNNSQGENNLTYNLKPVSYYGQVVYEPLPFTYLDVTVQMEK